MFRWCTTTSFNSVFSRTNLNAAKRFFASAREEKITSLLRQGLSAQDVQVVDVSGGCGAMFKIEVRAKQFKGKTLVQQHKMVNEILSEEIKDMHGLTLKTIAID